MSHSIDFLKICIACALAVVLSFPASVSASSVNYIAEGNKRKGEGDCAGAIDNYKLAKQHRQFSEVWGFYHSASECYIALRDYDRAIVSYGRVIDSTKNRRLQGEMYRGKGRAYYLKAKGRTLDAYYVDLAYKSLAEAKARAVDVSDIEKEISSDSSRLELVKSVGSRYDADEEKKIDEKMQEELNKPPPSPVIEAPVIVKQDVKEPEKVLEPAKKKTKKRVIRKSPVKKSPAADNSSAAHKKLSELHKGKTDRDGAKTEPPPFKDIFQKFGEGKVPPKKQQKPSAVDKDTTSAELEKLLKEVISK
ncbi:MAG: hypothetical protein HQL10_04335 [Nitrospirae bacterium]|nr:hypothetical protein [Nitrospirota bacterium]